jgi:hypothetical protein
VGAGRDALLPLVSALDTRAIFLGRFINHRFAAETFLKYVFVGLIGTGLLLLAQAAQRKRRFLCASVSLWLSPQSILRQGTIGLAPPTPVSIKTDSGK